MDGPTHPLRAVTHPRPYEYYAELATRQPVYFDDALQSWVVSSAQTVTATLENSNARVRPVSEAVPAAIAQTPVAGIFRHLVRMNDGHRHESLKPAVTQTLATIDFSHLAERARQWARVLAQELNPETNPLRLSEFALRLPVYVMADSLEVPAGRLGELVAWLEQYLKALAPGASPETISSGGTGAGNLLELVGSRLDNHVLPCQPNVLARLAEAGKTSRMSHEALVANGVGFLIQAYEATAGLIGNTLVTLSRQDEIRQLLAQEPGVLPQVIQEVLRFDPPIQNTRRFLAADAEIGGRKMNAGDAILVVLAAANRDPAANPKPERFEPFRENRRHFTFGHGAHACPGEHLAVAIAQAGVAHLLKAGIKLEGLAAKVRYRDSLNARIPLFSN